MGDMEQRAACARLKGLRPGAPDRAFSRVIGTRRRRAEGIIGMALCPYCNAEIPPDVEAVWELFDGDCPSSCDDKIVVELLCSSCRRVIRRIGAHADYTTGVVKDFNIPVEIRLKKEMPHDINYGDYEYVLEWNGELVIDIDGDTVLARPKKRTE